MTGYLQIYLLVCVDVSAKDLFTVAAHELGHSLGIEHSNTFGALMFPYYKGYNPKLELHEDDIAAIQAVYGRQL